jgi:hypothetical protein
MKGFAFLVNFFKRSSGAVLTEETTGENIIYYCHKLNLYIVVEERQTDR